LFHLISITVVRSCLSHNFTVRFTYIWSSYEAQVVSDLSIGFLNLTVRYERGNVGKERRIITKVNERLLEEDMKLSKES
jgi:hypothetical protein